MKQTSKFFRKQEAIPSRRKCVPTKTIAVDIDGTLVLYPEDLKITLEQLKSRSDAKVFHFKQMDIKLTLVPHAKNIALLKRFWHDGYIIIAWSRGSAEWAECVIKRLKLSPFVDIITSKPDFYLDDLDVSEWFGDRLFEDF